MGSFFALFGRDGGVFRQKQEVMAEEDNQGVDVATGGRNSHTLSGSGLWGKVFST